MGAPIRTGIQRIVRAIITHWPEGVDRTFVRHMAGEGFVTVHPEAVRYAVGLADAGDFDLDDALAEIAFLDRPSDVRRVELGQGDRLLAPELFFEGDRVASYRRAIAVGVKTYLIVPDFLVWLRPDRWSFANTNPFMPYLQLVLECHGRAFISGAVAKTFESRIAHAPTDARDLTLDLGADGLGVRRETFDTTKKTLLCLGTFDSRKGQDRVYSAFCNRGEAAADLKMVFVGRVPGWTDPILKELLNTSRPDVTLVTDASDGRVAEELRRARALVYTSPAEGYGLPPMESLYAGVPVVVHDGLPALEGKPTDGQIRLPDDHPSTIRDAIDRLASDEFTAELWKAAERFPGVTWRAVSDAVAEWVTR